MNKPNIINILVVFLAVFLVACSKDDEGTTDLTKPTAQIELLNESGVFLAGSSIVINGKFMDDIALKACEITVDSKRNLKGFDVDWNYDEDEIKLSGKEFLVEKRQILPVIPVDIYYGDYELTFKVIDQSDNYTYYKFDITIQ